MFEVRIHGRGGQGAVTAAELLSVAAFEEGRWAQAFPSFGSERMGAPVTAFCRVDQAPIRRREPIAEPDAVVVQDPTLLHHVNVFGGLSPDGCVLINSSRGLSELGLDQAPGARRMLTVPASAIARRRLGKPIPNVALLGGLVALTEVVTLEALGRAILARFPDESAHANLRAAEDAFRHAAGQQPAVAAIGFGDDNG